MTVKDLYREITGQEAHQRAIDGRLRKLPRRKQDMIRDRAAGLTWAAIGHRYGLTAGTADKLVRRALEAIRKSIAGEPRYNQVGRATSKPWGDCPTCGNRSAVHPTTGLCYGACGEASYPKPRKKRAPAK